MKEDNKRIGRSLIHIVTGVMILLFIINYSNTRWLLFYLLIASIIFSFLSYFYNVPVLNFILDKFELERHRKTFPGKSFIFFIAGSLLVIKLFPQNIALAGIAILTFADPVSHFASSFGKIKYPKPFNTNKTIVSTLLGITAGFIAGSIFIGWSYALIASILAMIAEAMVIKIWEDYVDDNYLIPLVAGTSIFLLQKII
jgi:dolichol kinase